MLATPIRTTSVPISTATAARAAQLTPPAYRRHQKQPGEGERERRPPGAAPLHQTSSRMVALAIPPPSHIVCRP